MAAVTGLTLVKKFTYRGDPTEEFSNTYHFKTQPPGDPLSWEALSSQIVGEERKIFPGSVSYQRAYGYDSDDPKAHAVFEYDWTLNPPAPTGSLPSVTGIPFAGDQAACVEWRLDKKNTRGKWIYLRKYVHAGHVASGSTDNLDSDYLAALEVFATYMESAAAYGGLRARAYDANITAHLAIPYVTTRTLKRRGKRPKVA